MKRKAHMPRRTPGARQTSEPGLSRMFSGPADIARLRVELFQAQKLSAVGELAASVAHEVNNVLTVVLGQAQLLLLSPLPDEVRERLRRLYGEASQASRIVQNLLYFARHQPSARREVGLFDLTSRVLDLMHYRFQTDQIQLATELEPVPPVQADGPQIQQAIYNVVQNAVQAMKGSHGGGSLTLRLRALGTAGVARIEVEDDGPGIPPGLLDKIFEPFFTTKLPGEGSGLGLSIAAHIVTEHGGKIWAENRPDRGARFVIELPLSKSARAVTSA